jgi:DNA-binding CsgD family transcriptional regulator
MRSGIRTNQSRDLTAREFDVIELVALGCANKHIARQLNISAHTVGQHLRRLFEKVGANSRAELVARAYVVGTLDPQLWPPRRPLCSDSNTS